MREGALLREVQDEQGHGHDGGEHAEPETGGVGLRTHDGAAALGHVVRLHVDDVVLLDVVGGRVVDALGVGEVDAVGHLVVALLTEHKDVLAQAADAEVARHGHRLEDVDAVLVNLTLALARLADDVEGETGVVDDDRGVEAEALAEDTVLDHLLQLVTGEACDLQPAQDGEVDGAVGGDGVAAILAVAAHHAHAAALAVEVEELGDVLVAAVYHDADAVAGLEADEAVSLGGNGVEDGEILEVGDVRRSAAGGQGQERQEKEGE